MTRDAALDLLRSQHTFPGDHTFHVIVRDLPGHAAGVSAVLAGLCELESLAGRVVEVPSRNGTYLSLRMRLPCPDAERVLDVYAKLGELPEVVRYL